MAGVDVLFFRDNIQADTYSSTHLLKNLKFHRLYYNFISAVYNPVAYYRK